MFTKRSIIAALAAPSLALAGPIFHTIAITGDAAPGLPGVKFDYLSDPRIGPSGKLLFWADLGGPGITPEAAGSIWSNRSGTLARLYQ
jgi:hypothetical protein